MKTHFYVSNIVSNMPFKIEYVGVEVLYPDYYDGYVTRQRAINRHFETILETHGVFVVHEGNWDEQIYVADSPKKSWLDSGVVVIEADWNIDHSISSRVVSFEDFVKLIHNRF